MSVTATNQAAATPALNDDAAGAWTLRASDRDAGRAGMLVVGPDGLQQGRIHEGDCLYQRTVYQERAGERFVEYERRRVAAIRYSEHSDAWFIHFADGRCESAMDVGRAVARDAPLDPDAPAAEWSQTSPDGFDGRGSGRWRTWEPVRNDELEPDVDLTFRQISGRGSRKTVNAFLEGETAEVDHALGGVASWKAAFVAEHDGEIYSALVVHAYHPSQNGTEAVVTRLANRADAPRNTSSWMLARVREWARDEGYDRVSTYSGVGANVGTCYRAAGFYRDGEPVERDGTDWSDQHHEGRTWLRQKWSYDLGA